MSNVTTTVKCVVWDLDNTVWDGVLLEGDNVPLREGVIETITTLDQRGILHSIASRNDPEAALSRLEEAGIRGLFVYPQIGWGSKSASVAEIARLLNIGTDAVAFVDDDPFERAEVAAGVPGVRCIDSAVAATLAARPEFVPRFVTEDSRRRRSMVQAEIERSRIESEAIPAEFLASLEMTMTITDAEESDLARVEELTIRTNQLNSTGITYSYEELNELRRSDRHHVLVAGLDDRFGTYGKIGLALVETDDEQWLIRLLLVSCRVMARGAGSVLLGQILHDAAAAGKTVRAEFVPTPRNRPMYLMFKLGGFREIARRDEVVVLEYALTSPPPLPAHVELRTVQTTAPQGTTSSSRRGE